jgi:hypothetical protein
LYVAYKDNPQVAMFLVYVREAHPVAEPKKPAEGLPIGPSDIGQHKSMDDRVLAASACRQGLELTLPMLIDTMDGVVERAYHGVPAATTIVDLDGNVAFYARGPRGVQPEEADAVLRRLLGEPPPEAESPDSE